MKKMKLKLTASQKKIIKQWFGGSRFTYNQCAKAMTKVIDESWHTDKKERKPFDKANAYTLRNLLVTRQPKKDTGENIGIDKHIRHKEEIYDSTPKEIRAFAVKDATTSFNNLRQKYFSFRSCPHINYRLKKNRFQTIGIPSTAIKTNCKVEIIDVKQKKRKSKNKKKTKKITTMISIYSKSFGEVKCLSKSALKIFGEGKQKMKHDVKLTYDGLDYWLCVPHEIEQKKQKPKKSVCGIDPGLRSFATCYEDNRTVEFRTDALKIKKLAYKLDRIHSEDGTNNSHRYLLESRRQRHRLDTVHTQVANFLAKRYGTIVLGRLDRQKFTRDKCHGFTQRMFAYLSHFKFRERLKLELSKFRKRSLIVTTEAYTSKTCGSCGNVKHDLGDAKVYRCDKCEYVADRDANAARNILLIRSKFGSEDGLSHDA